MQLLNRFLLAALVLTVVIAVPVSMAELNELQGPHDSTNAVSCGSCHVPVNNIPMPTPSNWLSNAVCRSCHSQGGVAVNANVHAVGDTMWCTTCHNPHQHQPNLGRWYMKGTISTPNSGDHALVINDTNDFVHRAGNANGNYTGVCQTCHTATGIFRNNASGSTPTPLHQGTGRCVACHQHKNGFVPFALDTVTNNAHSVTANCNDCHSYLTAGKTYTHPNDLAESLYVHGVVIPETLATTPRHATCQDCHSVHSLKPDSGIAGQINGTLYKQSGITMTGATISSVTKEYQVCLKCHSSSANLPAGENNKRVEFDTSNVAFHPVFGAGKNTIFAAYEARSTITHKLLKAPWSSTSTMNCTDCHGSDNPNGPQGMHGSNNQWILQKQFANGNQNAAGSGADTVKFSLCYSCHDQNYYRLTANARPAGYSTNDSARFSRHYSHTTYAASGDRQESCETCHDIHGSPNNLRMVRWDTTQAGVSRPDTGSYFGYYRYVNKIGANPWTLRDTVLAGRDTVTAFCFVKCHSTSGNHYGRSVRYRIAH